MQLGIFAKTFEGSSPAAAMGAAVRCGYRAVQYNMACSGLPPMPDHLSDTAAKAVADAAKAHGVSVAAVSGTFNMIHPDPAVRMTGLARLEVLAAHCKALSTGMITLCTGTRDVEDQWRWHPDNRSSEAWRDLLQSVAAACDIAERWDILLGVEPELANVVSDARQALRLMRELGSDRIRIVLDPANLFETATLEDQHRLISDSIGLLGEHIAMAHAKDRASDGSFAAAGTGVVDFRHFLACLAAAGCDGPLITHGLTAKEAPGVAEFLGETLAGLGLGAS
jgi:sugar phosphate isomerase/epimerase